MRPSVVWFGEALPETIWNTAELLVSSFDYLIVVGTSAVVSTAVYIIEAARLKGCKIIVINKQRSIISEQADIELIDSSGNILPALLKESLSNKDCSSSSK